MSSAKRTTDHQTIVEWVESRGGCPAHVKRSGGGDDPGILRIDYSGFSGEDSLEKLDWDTWFDAFEQNQLAFLYQDEKDSRFSKLVRRRPEDEHAEATPHRRGTRRKGGTAKVDLNTADEGELEALSGIGPATARRIVEYREREGKLRPEDLTKIDGINDATAQSIQRQLQA